MNIATPSLNGRLDDHAKQLSQVRRRINANVGELQDFAFEAEQRIDGLERSAAKGKRRDDVPIDTHSVDTGSTHSSTPLSPAAPDRDQIEGAAFSLEAMANLFESYLTSVSVNMPGSLLPSSRLSWGRNGSLVVDASKERNPVATIHRVLRPHR